MSQTGVDLSLIPAREPPPGKISDLINPPDEGYRLAICNLVCLLVVVTFYGLRMWTRIRVVKAVGYDDYCNTLALLTWLGTGIAFQRSVLYGIGRHVWNVSVANMYPHIMKLWVVAAMQYSVTMLMTKLSILIMYRRLFTIDSFLFRWWLVVFFTVGYSVGGFFSSLFQCWPIQSVWTLNMESEHCIDVNTFYIINAVLNVISDLLIIALPIPIVWGLNLRYRQKIILTFLFSLASLSSVISIMRMMYVVKIREDTYGDTTWDLFQVMVASQAELTAAFVCSCVPCLRPFFERYTPCLFSSHKGPNDTPSTRGPYVRTDGNSSRKTVKRSSNRDHSVFDDDLELGPTNYKSEAEITVSGPDSDSESTQEILRHEAGKDDHDRIVVQKTYNVKSLHEV